MADYTIICRDPFGNKVGEIVNFIRLDYACKENDVGTMFLDLPRSDIEAFFYKDLRMEIWRTVGAKTYLEANTVWFLRKWELKSGQNAVKTWTLTAYDANYLLKSREIEYYAGSAQTKKTDQIDDMLKAIVGENMLASAGADRDLSAYISNQTALGLAPTTTKAFARRNVLDVLQELAQDSYKQGTYLVFAIQYVNETMLEFRTFVNQLGINHNRASGQTVVVSEQRSNLIAPSLVFDYSDEITVVTAGGQGQDADRAVVTVVDTARATETPFSRREYFLDSIQSKIDTNALTSDANSELQAKRPIRTLTGTVQDTDQFAYGYDYNFGDIVVAEHEGYSFDAHVDRIHVTKSKDGETIDNKITGAV